MSTQPPAESNTSATDSSAAAAAADRSSAEGAPPVSARNVTNLRDQRGFRPLWPWFVLLGMVLIFFWDSLFAGQVLCMRDTFFDFMPWRQFARDSIGEGTIPLWNPYTNCGQPFAANPKSAVFYPLNVLFYVLPLTWAMKVSLALHVWIAAASTYALCRYWRLSIAPCLLAAVGFAFSTYTTAYLEFFSAIDTLAWCPLALLVMNLWFDRWGSADEAQSWATRLLRTNRCILALAIVLAMQFLAGATQNFLYSLLFVAVFALYRGMWQRGLATTAAAVASVLLAGAFALGLVMPQFLLTWELIGQSVRATQMNPFLDQASIHPAHWVTLLLPYLYGRPGYSGEFWAETQFEFWVGTFYVGLVPLVMLSFAALRRPGEASCPAEESARFAPMFLFAAAGFGLLMAAGSYTPWYEFFFHHAPGFNRFRWPGKWLQWVVISVSLLSAIGLQTLLDWAGTSRRSASRGPLRIAGLWFVAAMLLGTGGWLAYSSGRPYFEWLTRGMLPDELGDMGPLQTEHAWAVLWLGFAVGLVLVICWRPDWSRWSQGALVAVAFANLFFVSRQIHFMTDDGVYSEIPDTFLDELWDNPEIRVDTEYSRVPQYIYGRRDRGVFLFSKAALMGETAAALRIHTFPGGGTLSLKRHRRIFVSLATGELDDKVRNNVKDLLGIRYVFRKTGWSQRPRALPRAFLTTHWRVAENHRQAMDWMFDKEFDPHTEAILEAPPPPYEPRGLPPQPPATETSDQGSDAAGSVKQIKYAAHRVELEAQASQPALLVLGDAWYPGWRATVDGREVPILLANYLFRGVLLEPGRHTVVFSYRPWQLPVGGAVSLATMFAMAATLLVGRRRFGR